MNKTDFKYKFYAALWDKLKSYNGKIAYDPLPGDRKFLNSHSNQDGFFVHFKEETRIDRMVLCVAYASGGAYHMCCNIWFDTEIVVAFNFKSSAGILGYKHDYNKFTISIAEPDALDKMCSLIIEKGIDILRAHDQSDITYWSRAKQEAFKCLSSPTS